MSLVPPERSPPHIELHLRAQATQTAVVRTSRADLARAVARAAAELERGVGADLSSRRVLLALRRFEEGEIELAVCRPLRGSPKQTADLELAEIPAGRYLTLTSAVDARELATILPRLRDWLGEHREWIAGPTFLEVVGGRLVVRQRIIGGIAHGIMKPLAQDALAVLVDALRFAPVQLDAAS